MKTLLTFFLCSVTAACFAMHIGYLMPSGGQQGRTVELIVGGQQFWGLKGAMVSGGGVTVESVEAVRGFPYPPWQQRQYLKKWLDGIEKGNNEKPPLPDNTEGWHTHFYWERLDNLTPLERELTLRFLYVPRNPLQMSPAIASSAIVRLRIAPDAKPGEREFRLVSNGRISNPLRFYVDTLNEYREPFFPLPPKKPENGAFAVPGVLNGQIMPGETDYYRFAAKKNEEITFSMIARYLMPFIGDGVPGHFQPVLEVVDAKGKSLAFADDNYFDPDPVLFFKAPADGEYTLVVRDALYRGREDFVYRIRAVHGKPEYTVMPPPEFPGVKIIDAASLNRNEPAARPVMVRGVMEKGRKDSYLFEAQKGERIIFEVFARRLKSPLDSLIQVYDGKGKRIAVNDDCERLKAGVILHGAADSYLDFTVPADGRYTVTVSDTSGLGGRDYVYYLRIDQPRPRFTVYSVPSSLEVAMVGAEPLTLVAERHDGFSGEIGLKLKNGGDYILNGPKSIPAGCDRAVVTITTKSNRKIEPRRVEIEASSGDFRTTVIPGDEAMQAFAYTHIVPARRMLFTKRWKYSGAEKFSWASKHPVAKLAPEAKLAVNVNPRNFPEDAEAELEIIDPPDWVKVVPNDASRARPGQIISPKQGEKVKPYRLALTLARKPEGKGKAVNQLFKVVYKYNSKPDKEGKIRRVTSEIILPAVRLEGGSK